jgi:hypothetical protein
MLWPARSPSRPATLSIESSDSFVASAAVSIATGWSEPVPGRDLHPLKSSAFSRRTVSPIVLRVTDNAEHLSEIICVVNETEATKVLREARQLVKSEQYAAALEKYIWFHNHALDFDRALAGVRLSYAIAEWVDLGEVYPPARSALESVRDAKGESLAQGAYDVSLFHDVASINRAFGQVDRTSDLFKSIANVDRGVAAKCFNIALESLVRMKEFDLARSFISDPRKEIDHFAMPLKFASPQTQSVSPEMMQETFVRIYVKKVNLLLQIFTGIGDEEASNQLRHYAVECVTDAQLRDKIREQLYSSPPAPRIQ